MKNEFQPEPTETEATAQYTPIAAEQTALLLKLERNLQIRLAELIFSFVGAILCASLLILLARKIFPQFGNGRLVPEVALLFSSLTIPVWLGSKRKTVLTAERIRQIEGGKATGPLLDLLVITGYTQDIEAIYSALSLCLPQIKSDAPVILTGVQRQQLLKSLEESTWQNKPDILRPDFCIATLKALEQIGDASAIPLVDKISRMNANTPDRISARDAARECLPLLRVRAGLVKESATLLRASHAEDARPDTLLRPMSGAGGAAPHELLRPSDSGPTGP